MTLADDEREILELFEAGDRALMAADTESLSRIFADDYVQYGDTGEPQSRQQILASFRAGTIRYPSIISTGRKIRVWGETAVVHGSETDEVEADGKTFQVRYLYLDVLLKREGKWKLVASQLARPADATTRL